MLNTVLLICRSLPKIVTTTPVTYGENLTRPEPKVGESRADRALLPFPYRLLNRFRNTSFPKQFRADPVSCFCTVSRSSGRGGGIEVEAKPTVESLSAIADYFHVSMDYLWGKTNY